MTGDDTTPPDVDDPYAAADGSVGNLFAAEVGADVADLLADSSLWETPPAGLIDDVVSAVRTEAGQPDDQDPDLAASAEEHAIRTVPRDDAEVVELSTWRQVRAGLLGAAAAVVLLAGAVVLFSTTGGQPAETAFSAEMVPTGLVPDVGGEIEVIPVQSGLQIELDAPNLPRRDNGSFYEGWLRLDDDRLVPIGTFHEGADVTLWAGIELDRVVLMTITLESAVAGASPEQASSGEVVLKVDFPSE